ncbi:hypothetical protein ACJJTC_016577 [Scirpophaga incertulas]
MWLPPAFRSARFGTHALPPARHFEGEEEFDAGNAATPLDQIVTDRLTADDYPVVSLGQWTNFAELATGLGWATADQPSYNRASGRTGDSLSIDNVERAVLLRRAFEEYKAAACCADEVLAPNSNKPPEELSDVCARAGSELMPQPCRPMPSLLVQTIQIGHH